ncbi:ATP-binding protein [Metabacillus dongyingensis]|uniref:ATP-binding protein n=1 Tax=Metabacillus dongyingensis TaxID=2874282 RepID=UPI003B8D3371
MTIESIKELILHMTFILFPVFIYQTAWLSRPFKSPPSRNKTLIYLLCAPSAILCITYPLHIVDDLSFDLHSIPIVISILYGGPLSGALVILTVFAYHFYTGGNWLLLSMLTIPFYIILPYYLQRKWFFYNKQRKMMFILLIGNIKTAVTYSAMYLTGTLGLTPMIFSGNNTIILVLDWLFLLSAFFLSQYAIEYIHENAMMRYQIIKNEKLSIISELAASVAHEVRNPLTVVRGFIQLMGQELQENEHKNKDYFELVLSELDRAQDIITDYLNLAKQQYFEKEKVSLSSLLIEVDQLMRSYANYKTVTIETKINSDLVVYGDNPRLKQVFINLLKNAIEAVPDFEGQVFIRAYSSHEYIRIKITDNGNGMTADQLERLGEPYFTLKEKGTGLGLTVTFSIIHHHSGTIRYQSAVGEGTTVTVSLPIQSDAQ